MEYELLSSDVGLSNQLQHLLHDKLEKKNMSG